jgi:hypothetical protein
LQGTPFLIEEVIMKKEKKIYLENWKAWEDVMNDFGHKMAEPKQVFAYYDIDGYDGNALVIWKEGKTYKVIEAWHCSCFGLSECPWEPTDHTAPEIEKFLDASYGHWADHREEIKAWM